MRLYLPRNSKPDKRYLKRLIQFNMRLYQFQGHTLHVWRDQAITS